MSTAITVPVTRAVDRALRMLQLTYQMVSMHRGITVAEALRRVAGYTTSTRVGEPTRSAGRKFEHDKKGLRSIGIPITVQLFSDPPSSCYKVRARDLLLPPFNLSQTNWGALRASASALQGVADLLPSLPVMTAAPIVTVLMAYCEELDLHLPPWSVPQAVLGHGPTMLEWIHSMLYLAARRGRAVQPWGGAPVPLDGLRQRTGLSNELIWHIAERGGATPDAGPEWSHAVRVIPVSREDGLGVIAPEMKAPWRPRLSHTDTLIAAAAAHGRELGADCIRALRELSRARPASVAHPMTSASS